jgi:hypothetical protein
MAGMQQNANSGIRHHGGVGRLQDLLAWLKTYVPWRSPLLHALVTLSFLIVLVLWMKNAKEHEERRFAKAVSQPMNGTLMLEAQVPQTLLYRTPQEVGQPLIISLDDAPGTGVTGVFTVTFTHDSRVQLQRQDKQPLSSPIVLSATTPVRLETQVLIRPSPLIEAVSLTSPLTIEVTAENGRARGSLPIQLTLESSGEMRRRLLRDTFVADLALPLGTVVALLGWYLEERRRHQEAARERYKEKLQAWYTNLQQTNAQIDQGDVNSIQSLLALRREAQQLGSQENESPGEVHQKWEAARQKLLDSRRSQEMLLQKFGRFSTAYEVELIVQWHGELKELWAAHPQDQGLATQPSSSPKHELQDLLTICQVFLRRTALGQQETKAIVDAIFALWDRFNDDARDLLVEVIRQLRTAEHFERLLKRALEDQECGRERRRIVRDQRLATVLPDSILALRHMVYQWRPLQSVDTKHESAEIAAWLSALEITTETLAKRDLFSPQPDDWYEFSDDSTTTPMHPHSLLLLSRATPNNFERLLHSSPTIITSPEWEDRLAAIYLMRYQLLFEQTPAPFILKLSFPFSQWQPSFPRASMLRMLASAVAEGWLGLKKYLPGVFLELTQEQRQAVTELLLWHTGSPTALYRHLEQVGLAPHRLDMGEKDAERRLFFRKLSDVLELQAWPLASESKLQQWITQRPPDLVGTFFLMDYPTDKVDRRGEQQVLALCALAETLANQQVYLKLFLPAQRLDLSRHIARIRLRWQVKDLVAMLNQRLAIASSGQLTDFHTLFYPSPAEDVTQKVAVLADGSLVRMLKYYQQAILRQIRNQPLPPLLNEKAFLASLPRAGVEHVDPTT